MPLMVRYKCLKTKPHQAVFHPFIYLFGLPCYFQYQIFIPMVNKVMLKHRINHQRYDMLICRIVKVCPQSR